MINGVRLQSFRSYLEASYEFDDGVNIIVGPNASGKTNLLEAILYICQGKSYRSRDIDVIKNDQPWARIDANSVSSERVVKLQKSVNAVDKSFEIDGKTYKRPPFNKLMPVVLFEPNHLRLVSGSPERRRDYIDEVLAQTVAGYSSLLRQYKRTLAQRNSLLKQSINRPDKKQFFSWDLRLSELAGQIARERISLINRLNDEASKVYSSLAGKNNQVALDYQSSCNQDSYESSLLNKLEKGIHDDLSRGFTSYGPHRDDIRISLNGQPALVTASRGEIRTLVLMLKVSELTEIERSNDKLPILLLDDVFSELDGRRRQSLTKYLEQYQTFITTTDADIVLHDFTSEVKVVLLQ